MARSIEPRPPIIRHTIQISADSKMRLDLLAQATGLRRNQILEWIISEAHYRETLQRLRAANLTPARMGRRKGSIFPS